ncbi:MAG TPA: tetratricopeptide repeat protein [Polyangiaceae bacterium]|nr:tetratricopeptide repeat protein [Polyangiaceae bacterium]
MKSAGHFRAWLLGLALCACRQESAPKPARASAPAQAASEQAAPLGQARQLALQPTRENTLTDRKLQGLGALAQAAPRRSASWIELGRTWVQKARESNDPGYYSNADACVALALDVSPDDALALDLRTLVLLNDHRFREARELAEKQLAKNPESAPAWGSASDALLELGELEAAERAAEKMLDLKPNLPAYSRVSYLRWLRGNVAEARELARLAIDAGNDPRAPEPRAWMLVQAALLFWNQGDIAGADAGFQRALEVSVDYPPALVGRARVALAEHDAARAARLLEQAHRASPLVETAWLLGKARSAAGDAPGAARAYADAEREGQRSDPRTLALMLAARGIELERALTLARRERETRGDIYTDDTLAWALYRNRRFEEAKAAMVRARRWSTPDPRLLFHEGAIRLALGDTARGRRLLETALTLNPHFDVEDVAEARKLLHAGAG